MVQRKWLSAFAVHAHGGRLAIPSGYLWHLFSFGLREHRRGARARSEYERQAGGAWLLFSEDLTTCVSASAEETLPVLLKVDDWYVVSSDFSWTYVVTHEDTEYFARKRV